MPISKCIALDLCQPLLGDFKAKLTVRTMNYTKHLWIYKSLIAKNCLFLPWRKSQMPWEIWTVHWTSVKREADKDILDFFKFVYIWQEIIHDIFWNYCSFSKTMEVFCVLCLKHRFLFWVKVFHQSRWKRRIIKITGREVRLLTGLHFFPHSDSLECTFPHNLPNFYTWLHSSSPWLIHHHLFPPEWQRWCLKVSPRSCPQLPRARMARTERSLCPLHGRLGLSWNLLQPLHLKSTSLCNEKKMLIPVALENYVLGR